MRTIDELLEDLREFRKRKQIERGLPDFFEEGDIVRFPQGVWYNREKDYVIEQSYSNGFVVSNDGFTQEIPDEAVIRLGMTKTQRG